MAAAAAMNATGVAANATTNVGGHHGGTSLLPAATSVVPGARERAATTLAASLALVKGSSRRPNDAFTISTPFPPFVGRAALMATQRFPPVHGIEVAKVVKAIAFFTNILLQLSPVRTMREIRRAGSTADLDALPFFTLFFSSLQWSFYASAGLALTGNAGMIDVIYANVGGVLLGASYLYSFYHHSDTDKRKGVADMLWAGVCLLAFELLCLVILLPSTFLRIQGAICAFLNIAVSASPLVAIEDIFRTQSVASMQTDMVVICFSGSCAWATMGFILNDMCIALPNCFGIVIGGLQVHLILKFTETGLWKSNDPASSTSAHLRHLGAADSCSETARVEGGYEASVYTRVKIFVLLSVAHARFVVENYAAFAVNTLMEVWRWASELELQGKDKCRWHCGRHGCGKKSSREDEGESLRIL